MRNSVQNFETFSFPRGVMEKPSKYGVVTHSEKILSANHGSMSHLVPNHMHPPPYTTKNAFVQTVVETKPRRVVAGGGIFIDYKLWEVSYLDRYLSIGTRMVLEITHA